MTATMPALSGDERAAALRKATQVRMERRAFKDALERGDVPLGLAIERAKGKEALAGIRVLDLLQCYSGIGPRRAETLMDDLGIARSRRIRGLGPRQASALLKRVKS